MKKPITDEKFYITDIPKDKEKIRELIVFLGDKETWTDYQYKAASRGKFIMYDADSSDYGYGTYGGSPEDYHTVVTYDDLLANYLPKDSKIDKIVDEAIEEVINEDYQKPNKYKKQCKGIEIDVYDVLKAYNVVNPAIQHAIKKLLAGGQRGYKDIIQDYNEAIQSLQRGIELENQK